MTKDERQQSLINARRACLLLAEYAVGDSILILGESQREAIADLLEQFGRLDVKERKQAAQGKHGAAGGRPKKAKVS